MLALAVCASGLTLKELQDRIDNAYRVEQQKIDALRMEWVGAILPKIEEDIAHGQILTCVNPKDQAIKFQTQGFCSWWDRHVEGVSCTGGGLDVCFHYSADYHTKLTK